jgi:hypothetical protein
MLSRILLFIGFAIMTLCAFGQGLTLRDVSFVSATGNVSAGGTTGGGSPTAPPTPTEWWEMDETGSNNRIGSVTSLAMVPANGAAGTGPGHDTGLINNAFKMLASNGVNEPAARLRNTAGFGTLATDGSSISLAFWIYAAPTATPWVYFDIYDGGFSFLSSIEIQYIGSDLYMDAYNDTPSELIDIELTSHGGRDSSWHFWVIVWDSSTSKLKFSEDGGAFTLSSGTITLQDGAQAQLLIEKATLGAEYRIDQFGIWTTHGLTDNEIDWLYDAGAGREYTDF